MIDRCFSANTQEADSTTSAEKMVKTMPQHANTLATQGRRERERRRRRREF